MVVTVRGDAVGHTCLTGGSSVHQCTTFHRAAACTSTPITCHSNDPIQSCVSRSSEGLQHQCCYMSDSCGAGLHLLYHDLIRSALRGLLVVKSWYHGVGLVDAMQLHWSVRSLSMGQQAMHKHIGLLQFPPCKPHAMREGSSSASW